MHKQLLKIITVIATLTLVITLIASLFHKEPEIVKVGEIPKTFNERTTDLPIKEPRKKTERENTIPSVISDKTIYLTFDDGPSNITDKILDILKEENVPATFFVTGRHIDEYQNTIKRADQDGHTVALHTDTHNYGYVYSSEENYFNDLKQIGEKVYQITGHHARIVRLPGGSSNTVSKKYNKGVVTRITESLKRNDYYYFDWNVDSEDASGTLPAYKIHHNTLAYLHPGTNIILMHDTAAKRTTLEALQPVIKDAKAKGYTFARITKATQPIRHHVNN